jgi:hypothetical protein
MPDVLIDKAAIAGSGSVGEKISAMATAILREQAVLAKYFRDVSAFAVKGVDSITFPGIGSFTVSNRAHGETNDKQAPGVFKDTLALDQNAYLKYGIDSASEVESALNWKLECARIAAEDHVDYFEGKLLQTAEQYAKAVDVTLETGDIEIARCFAALRKEYVNSKSKKADALWIISSDMEEKILANPSLLSITGVGSAYIENGEVKKIYGFPVEVKINAANDILLVNTKAVNFGFQLAPKYKEQPDVNYGTDGVLCAMDQKFGTGAAYVEASGPNAGKSKVIFKLGTVA